MTQLYEWQVQEMMRKRCEEQGHVYENCCSMLFRLYQKCKYCGEEK
jgi:hypothetical protein